MKNVILKNKMFRSLILASSLMISAFSAQADLILSFGEDNIEVSLNETFTVQLFANVTSPSDAIGIFELDINFDSRFLSYDSFALNSLFMPLIDPSIIGGLYPTQPFPFMGAVGSNLLLGTFTFTALDYGTKSLSTENESFRNLLRSDGVDTSALSNISVVPAPATSGLFAVALVGLVRLRRKS